MVITFIKKYKIELLVLFSLFVIYFFTRLINIMTLPIFTDEALYVRWGQIANNDANQRFISLTDGKPPLLIWLTMVSMRIFDEPLFSGRFVSVVAGAFSLTGIFLLGKEVFKNIWIGILSAVLYVLYPFALVYDRMALNESLVGAFTIWGLYLAVLLVRTVRLDVALIFGIVSGLSVLNKSNGFFNVILLPVSLLLFDLKGNRKMHRFLKWVGLALVVTLFTHSYYSLLRLSPYFYLINQKNTIFIYPFQEWIQHPFTFLFDNLNGQINWLIVYFSPPMLALIVGAFVISRSYFKEKVVLLFWFLFPFLILGLFGKTLYPRYILFMTLSLLPLCAYTLYMSYLKFKKTRIFVVIFMLSVTASIRTDFFIMYDFANASIPLSDVSQYNNNWPSGAGVRESIEYFKKISASQKIFVATQGTFGLLPHAFEIYLVDDPNIIVRGIWPISEDPPQEVIDASKKMPTFFVFYQPCTICAGKGYAPDTWNYKIVLQIRKAAPDARFTVYQIHPK